MERILDYYESYDEWARLERHKIEFDITRRYLDRYLAGGERRILDVGGGPGRYAFYLAKQGHRVTLLDLSDKHIAQARARSEELDIPLESCTVGNALDLEVFHGGYDAVLLMGPLYHLLAEADRVRAVEQARRCLRPGGLLAAAFVSAYPVEDLRVCLREKRDPGALLRYLQCGADSAANGFTAAQEARALMADRGLRELVFAGVENILGYYEDELTALEDSLYQKWLDVGYALSRDPNLYGASMHFLYIGEIPGDTREKERSALDRELLTWSAL